MSIITIDFDGTIVQEKNYPSFGDPLPGALQTIEQLYYREHILILNTLREFKELDKAIDFLSLKEIYRYFHYVNENDKSEVEKWGHDPRKIAADYHIDDRNIGWNGWKPVRDFFCLDINYTPGEST